MDGVLLEVKVNYLKSKGLVIRLSVGDEIELHIHLFELAGQVESEVHLGRAIRTSWQAIPAKLRAVGEGYQDNPAREGSLDLTKGIDSFFVAGLACADRSSHAARLIQHYNNISLG